jgi:hypothetical protein
LSGLNAHPARDTPATVASAAIVLDLRPGPAIAVN